VTFLPEQGLCQATNIPLYGWQPSVSIHVCAAG
jgi:hypothetical protein